MIHTILIYTSSILLLLLVIAIVVESFDPALVGWNTGIASSFILAWWWWQSPLSLRLYYLLLQGLLVLFMRVEAKLPVSRQGITRVRIVVKRRRLLLLLVCCMTGALALMLIASSNGWLRRADSVICIIDCGRRGSLLRSQVLMTIVNMTANDVVGVVVYRGWIWWCVLSVIILIELLRSLWLALLAKTSGFSKWISRRRLRSVCCCFRCRLGWRDIRRCCTVRRLIVIIVICTILVD